jgi:hypothetical protein
VRFSSNTGGSKRDPLSARNGGILPISMVYIVIIEMDPLVAAFSRILEASGPKRRLSLDLSARAHET